MESGKHSVVDRPELLGAFEARATCSEAVLDGAGIGELYSKLYPLTPKSPSQRKSHVKRAKTAKWLVRRPKSR